VVGYAYLAGTSSIAQGPPASAGTSLQSLGYNGPAEATMWSHNGNVLTAQWINSDGSKNPTQTFYDPAVNFVGLVGDLTAFNTSFPGENAVAVTLQFTGTFPTAAPEPSSFVIFGTALAIGIAMVRRKFAALFPPVA
jgi:hypothetical protein